MTNTVDEIQRQYLRACEALRKLEESHYKNDVRNSWEDFLAYFSRAIGKLIYASINAPQTRAFGHRLKRASTIDDEGLVYLREARNVDDHGLEPSAHYTRAEAKLDGLVTISEGSKGITFGEIISNGESLGGMRVDTDENGKFTASGDAAKHLRLVAANIDLQTIFNTEKRIEAPPPKSVFGQTLKANNAVELAQAALDGLFGKIEAFQNEIGQK